MISAQLPPKPTFSPFQGLPSLPALAALQARPQWVVWDYRLNSGRTKWTKPPLRAVDGRNASHSDPSTCRVDGDVAAPIPHRPGRADFPHPVPHERDLLTAA